MLNTTIDKNIAFACPASPPTREGRGGIQRDRVTTWSRLPGRGSCWLASRSTVTGVALMSAHPLASQAIAAGAVQTRRATRPNRLVPHAGVRSTKTAARFDPLLPFDDRLEFGAKLGTYPNARAGGSAIGLPFGQMKYGRRYRAAIAATGLDYQTLRNHAVVSRRFEVFRRGENLTFQHHAEVCALPDAERDIWLDRAAAAGWSRNQLRRHLHGARDRASDTSVTLRLAVDRRRAQSWCAAAERNASSLQVWATRVVDDAAAASAGI
jgi:hypothetical protein